MAEERVPCPLCGGPLRESTTHYVDHAPDGTWILVQDVPCLKCQCGYRTFSGEALDRIVTAVSEGAHGDFVTTTTLYVKAY